MQRLRLALFWLYHSLMADMYRVLYKRRGLTRDLRLNQVHGHLCDMAEDAWDGMA